MVSFNSQRPVSNYVLENFTASMENDNGLQATEW